MFKISSDCYIKTCRSLKRRAIFRSSRPEVFFKKGFLRNFAEQLRWSLFFNKVAGLRPATLLKKRLWRRCFSLNFVKFLRTALFTKHLWWLLLYFKIPFKIPFFRRPMLFRRPIPVGFKMKRLKAFPVLTFSCLMFTKRSLILKQTCSRKPQVCLSMCDLLADIRH